MTQPAAQEQQALAALIQTLAYAQGLDAVTEALGAAPGVSTAGVRLLLTIPQVRGLVRLNPEPGAHAAVHAMHRLNLMRRAAYLVQAARRLTRATRTDTADTAIERRWLQQHLRAMRRRVEAAQQVAAADRTQRRLDRQEGRVNSGLLGWYAVLDDRTSSECRLANGRNFDSRRVPPIGFPGAVHPSCRCKPGPPHDTVARVEEVAPDFEKRVRVSLTT